MEKLKRKLSLMIRPYTKWYRKQEPDVKMMVWGLAALWVVIVAIVVGRLMS